MKKFFLVALGLAAIGTLYYITTLGLQPVNLGFSLFWSALFFVSLPFVIEETLALKLPSLNEIRSELKRHRKSVIAGVVLLIVGAGLAWADALYQPPVDWWVTVAWVAFIGLMVALFRDPVLGERGRFFLSLLIFGVTSSFAMAIKPSPEMGMAELPRAVVICGFCMGLAFLYFARNCYIAVNSLEAEEVSA